MMTIVDELPTPGCPNCCVKHLSAAVAQLVDTGIAAVDASCADGHRVLAARAYINLVEHMTGYVSHLHFAVGLLERAEELAAEEGDVDFMAWCRGIRTTLTASGDVRAAVKAAGARVAAVPLALAHLREAQRELPCVQVWDGRRSTVREIMDMIENVRNEWFPTDLGEEGKGGEDTMACSKKRCAAKGGQTAKAAGKTKAPVALPKGPIAKKGKK